MTVSSSNLSHHQCIVLCLFFFVLVLIVNVENLRMMVLIISSSGSYPIIGDIILAFHYWEACTPSSCLFCWHQCVDLLHCYRFCGDLATTSAPTILCVDLQLWKAYVLLHHAILLPITFPTN